MIVLFPRRNDEKSYSTSPTRSSMPPTVGLANKLQRLALDDPEFLKTIEELVDRRLNAEAP